jgi:uncharacterized repeat protein (TIGR03803 family)
MKTPKALFTITRHCAALIFAFLFAGTAIAAGHRKTIENFSGVAAHGSPEQTFDTLVSFDGTNGDTPEYVTLVQGLDGDFYGTTVYAGANHGGTLFDITAGGTLNTVYNFCAQANCADGSNPYTGVVLATNGNFYGTNAGGGAHGYGTVFELTPAGALTLLYNFCSITNELGCADGASPLGALIQGTDGNFYGTTQTGGTNDHGTVFKITPAGKLTTLHSFGTSDGCYPVSALLQAANGNFYGTTSECGVNKVGKSSGTVFEITPAGKLTTLYSFCSEANCTDGAGPSGLVLASDDILYGATGSGGVNQGCGSDGKTSGCGTIFNITPAGVLTTLYSFCSQTNCADGIAPTGLAAASDGNFYGITVYGGTGAGVGCDTGGCGTVFNVTAAGALTTLHTFCTEQNSEGFCADGSLPLGTPLQGTNGSFYGTTSSGGTSSYGTVYNLSVALGPFVKTNPTSGKVGASVIILGNNLTGTTAVSFNGTAATFTVVSATEITATVPAGATSGEVEVTTPKRTLKSDVKFEVEP